MRTLQLSIFFSASALTLVVTGCGSNRPDWEPSDPEERVALVTTGVTQATGTVEASSVKEIFAAYQTSGAPLAIVLGALASTNFAGEKCVTKSADEGTVDLDCASDGQATGIVEFRSDDEITPIGEAYLAAACRTSVVRLRVRASSLQRAQASAQANGRTERRGAGMTSSRRASSSQARRAFDASQSSRGDVSSARSSERCSAAK